MVLEDHIRKKRRLIPPLRAALGDSYSTFSWSLQIVPELFWMTLLTNDLGYVRGVEVSRRLGSVAAQVSKKDPKPLFATATSFLNLSEVEKAEFLLEIDEDTLLDVRNSLGVISVIWPDNPFSFICLQSDDIPQVAIDYFRSTLEEMYDRYSRAATLSICTAVYLGIDQDKIILYRDIYENNKTVFRDIEAYPSTESSRRAGSFFRSMAPMLVIAKEDAADMGDWVDAFWSGLSALGGCAGEYQDIPELPDITEGVEGFIAAFKHFAHDDFRVREGAWDIDLAKPQERQVILSLLARQATLSIEIVSNPGIWNANTAPIMLRAMADVHITLVWILQNPKKRALLYVQDGLGAIKLEIAHRKEELEKGGIEDAERQKKYIDYMEKWLDYQQIEFLTEINLGSWSGTNARAMAQEAGCIDFYNYVFQPFSAAVHSSWHHVGRVNVEYCQNPTHNFHLLPVIPSFEIDTHWCRMAGSYLSKTLRAFDEFIGKPELPVRSYSVVLDALAESDSDSQNENSSCSGQQPFV